MNAIYDAVPALVVALGAVVIARLMLESQWVIVAMVTAGLILIGVAAHFTGRKCLPEHPVCAVYLMEIWLFVPLSIAALVGGLIICLAILATPSDAWSTETKELVKAAATAITTFLTVVFVKDAETADQSWLAKRIKKAFYSAYESRFSPGHPGRNIVYDLHRGWGRDERRKRARDLLPHLT